MPELQTVDQGDLADGWPYAINKVPMSDVHRYAFLLSCKYQGSSTQGATTHDNQLYDTPEQAKHAALSFFDQLRNHPEYLDPHKMGLGYGP
jgi:hypothetical protein